MNAFDIRNISYSLQGKQILQNLNLIIPQGSFISIVGMNGSGKTTLLKLLNNYLKPTAGKILLYDKNLDTYSIKALARKQSIVFQSSKVDFDFSALQIVLMGRMPYQKLFSNDSKQDMMIAEQSMRQTNTWQLRNHLISSLSGGEQQRVFIARSLTQQTPIILLDEAVANLDLKHQLEIMHLLKQIQQTNNTTIIMVLHNLSLALKYSSYVLALKNGKQMFFDEPDKVLTPQNINTLFEVSARIVDVNNVILQDN